MSWQIAADIREMFTEVAATNGGEVYFVRTLNRKDMLSAGFTEALNYLPAEINRSEATLFITSDFEDVFLRERWFSPAAFLSTEGFENLIEIGDQTRTELFSLMPKKPDTYSISEHCYGLTERTLSNGEVQVKLNDEEIEFIAEKLKLSDIKNAAVCFLHSKKNPSHEILLSEKFKFHEITIHCSHIYDGNERERGEKALTKALLSPSRKSFEDEFFKLGFHSSSVNFLDGAEVRHGRDKKISEKASASFSLTCLEDKFILSFNGRTVELEISPLSLISLDEELMAQIGPIKARNEPGPLTFGKGLSLTLIDLMVYSRGLKFDDLSRLKMDAARALRQIIPMAKQLRLSTEETSLKFIALAYELLVLEIKNFSTRENFEVTHLELIADGTFAELFAPQISKRLNVKSLKLEKHAQWTQALKLIPHLIENSNVKLEKGGVQNGA
jgi:N-methylhydantoinase A/oxoprolinase/acetone carboxylase beta subunit